MLYADLMRDKGILILKPDGQLHQSDFERLTLLVDPFLEAEGRLHGVMVWVQTFPHWDSFKALLTHINFVRSHQKYVQKIAVVTDDMVLSIVPSLLQHFIQAEVRHFAFADKTAALAWLSGEA